jgi:hypothetical protein
MPADPDVCTMKLTAQLPAPSPYLAGSITMSFAVHCSSVSAQVPSMTFGKVTIRTTSARAACTSSPDITMMLAVRMLFNSLAVCLRQCRAELSALFRDRSTAAHFSEKAVAFASRGLRAFAFGHGRHSVG